MDPRLEFVLEAHINLAPPLELGAFPGGKRRVIAITGGTFEGPRLAGRIVPGGADWQIVRPDGTAELQALYTLEATDGTLIGVVNRGLRRGPPEILARLAAGEAVPPDSYYMRTVPVFEPPTGPHDWLARSIFVGLGERHPAEVVMRFYELK